jgi:hypothetical protein
MLPAGRKRLSAIALSRAVQDHGSAVQADKALGMDDHIIMLLMVMLMIVVAVVTKPLRARHASRIACRFAGGECVAANCIWPGLNRGCRAGCSQQNDDRQGAHH